MPLNPQVIRDSFEVAKPIASDVVSKFYEILWTDFPQSKALFEKADMEKQKTALIGGLVYIVDHLEDGEKLVSYLEQMGARHTNYGAAPEHYDWVGQSLLKTFAFFFKEKWTPELQEQWTIAYGVISDTMKKGAAEAAGKAA